MTAPEQIPEARKVALVGVACGLGGADAHCAEGPAALLAAGLVERLRARPLAAALAGTGAAPRGARPAGVRVGARRWLLRRAYSLPARQMP